MPLLLWAFIDHPLREFKVEEGRCDEPFSERINNALGTGMAPDVTIRETSPATLPSWFAVSELAVASVRAAAAELGDLLHADDIVVDRRLVLKWFGMTLRPLGGDLSQGWDALAGDYAAADGWIRCHTNAPLHRQAALSILGCSATGQQ